MGRAVYVVRRLATRRTSPEGTGGHRWQTVSRASIELRDFLFLFPDIRTTTASANSRCGMTGRIACGHCHGHHPSVAEARACAIENPLAEPFEQHQQAPRPDEETPTGRQHNRPSAQHTVQPAGRSANSQRRTGRSTQPRPAVSGTTAPETPLAGSPADLAGPEALGRSVLLDQHDAVPEPWQGLEEIDADAEADAELTERLHRAWRQRERIIIRWTGPLPNPEPVVQTPFHTLTVDEQLPGEVLRFAVTANTVDVRADKPRFAPISRALSLGATQIETGGDGDALVDGDVLVDGVATVVDGGPTDAELASTLDSPLVPRIHLLVGRLDPIGTRRPPGADLAPDQLAAVAHRRGAARILAPAGSGKTRVLTERARHLVNDCGVTGQAVSLVAYNRRAKDEMVDRLGDVAAIDIRTLNSLALAVATGTGPFRTAGSDRRSAPTTISEIDARRLLDKVLPGRRRKKLSDPLEPWIDALSACRLGLRDPHVIEGMYGGDVTGFPDVLDSYRAELKRANLIDFDEQILLAIERLLTDVSVRRVARAAAPLLLVDEFQDLTPAHLLLIRLVAGPAAEVFGVGDDDQTIYGYAGASPDWLIHFDRFFPGAEDHRLTINYRCPTDVVDAASNLLSHNQHRVSKQITAADGARADGLLTLTGGDANDALVSHVGKILADGAEPSDIAVLARVNAALIPAAVYLTEAGIPAVRPPGLTGDMLDRSGVGAAMSWLRLAAGPARGFHPDDLRLALRRPPRSLHPRVADWACEQDSVRSLVALSQRLNTERESETIAAFAADIEALRSATESGATTEELLEQVYDSIGLLGAASQLDRSQRTARRAAHADELAALAAVARLHPTPASFGVWLRSTLDAVPRFDPEQPPDGVTLATIHTTKGLEWPHVIVHDVRDGLHPHRLADDVEEERRIFHVGITRGRRSVAVAVSGPPSPFVAQLHEARPADQPWPADVVVSAGRDSRSNPPGKNGNAARPERAEPASESEAGLRDALASWRRERCKADAVPAYVVLDNKTLDAIARAAPSTLAALGSIAGIGPTKLDRYGSDILGIVASIIDS